tara:strand:+ start:662 stop:1060 length:399 start_codon:yes stop_codon:yes gene_type:complete
MGGTDERENIIELTPTEHADAHRILYEEHGKKEDLLAWKGLSAQIGEEEVFLMKSSIGGHGNKGRTKSKEHRQRIADSLTGRLHTEERKQNISKSMIGNTNSKNHSRSEYKKKQSLAMKAAWARRKENNMPS